MLRSGCVALVVMEITKPEDLTEGRRLHLVAQEGIGSTAAHTRRHCPPAFATAHTQTDTSLPRCALTPGPTPRRDGSPCA
ncbi:hypothetical protein DA792_09020 [Celeribacter baekdonensis]|uniref:Uncharacterized protein n=1 Tax=Celeribacter baekdonensis TaxID=875171 RepID=A0A2R4M1W5_9RHOB|nr:hypothetical protein DA792_09020 [Celeribacter baekdonensis]